MQILAKRYRRAAIAAASAAVACVATLTTPSIMTADAATTSTTLFGTSVWTGDGTTFEKALARQRAKFGNLQVVRTYYQLPKAWPGNAGLSGTPVVVSVKAPAAEITSGKHDATFTNWFKTAPRDRKVFWTYWHEPEDDIRAGVMTADAYRAAFQRLDTLAAKAANPNLLSTTIHMAWTLNPKSGADWNTIYPGDAYVDVLGFDCYDRADLKGTYSAPSVLLDRVVNLAKSHKKQWGIAELGTNLAAGDTGAGRAAWLRSVASYSRTNQASFISYWDALGGPMPNPDFRLLDSGSITAWKGVVAGQ